MIRRSTAFAGMGVALALVAAACGDDDSSSGASTTAAASTTTAAAGTTTTAGGATTTAAAGGGMKIGLVTDVGKVDDKSFNQSAWEGAQAAAKEIGGSAEYIETKDSKDYETNIKQLIDKGNKIIVTVGFALGEATAKAAKANPSIKFIAVDSFQGEVVPNVTGLVFNEDKAGFMAGALAGLLTKSNTVGAVLGTDKVPPVVAFKVGWENGAKYTNPNVKLISTFHPGGLDKAFTDPAWGASTAKQALDNGADVIFGAGGNTGNGALTEIAKKAGAYCVGVDTDQWFTVPAAQPCLVTSAQKLINPGIVSIVKQIKDGSVKGGNFFGDVGLAPFHDFDAKIPADVKTKVKDISAKVLKGEIPTGYKP
jgi:basic membrane protein A